MTTARTTDRAVFLHVPVKTGPLDAESLGGSLIGVHSVAWYSRFLGADALFLIEGLRSAFASHGDGGNSE